MEAVDLYMARTESEMKRLYGTTYVCQQCKHVQDFGGQCERCHSWLLIDVNDVNKTEDDEDDGIAASFRSSQ